MNPDYSRLYKIDTDLYQLCKNSDGQSSYRSYSKSLCEQLQQNHHLLKRRRNVASSYRSNYPNSKKKGNIAVILNNDFLMAHVTALAECLPELSNHLKVWILVLNPKNLSRLETFLSKYVDNISIKNASTLQLLQHIISDNSIDSMLWWGWPPGQWLGPLAFSYLTQISVSFKYDYPSVPGFNAHFICYGDQYCNFIAGNDADIFPFRLGLIPDDISPIHTNSSHTSKKSRKQIIFGCVGREEKIAQRPFLEALSLILSRNSSYIFCWTGRSKRQDVVDFFNSKGLQHQNLFVGYQSDPMSFIGKLDVYLDSFPFGTGQMLLDALHLGIRSVSVTSPYECHFSSVIQEIFTDNVPSSLSGKSISQYVDQADLFASEIISNLPNYSASDMKSERSRKE